MHIYNIVALSTANNPTQTFEHQKLLEERNEGELRDQTDGEEKDIPGEFVYPTAPNMTKEVTKQEKENRSPSRSPKKGSSSSPPSSNNRLDKKELKLKLNVHEAAKHNMQRNWSQYRNNPELLTPGSRGTPKRKS